MMTNNIFSITNFRWLLGAAALGTMAFTGCTVQPGVAYVGPPPVVVGPAVYVAPQPVYVAQPVVYVAPQPVYVGGGGYYHNGRTQQVRRAPPPRAQDNTSDHRTS
jgi:hypothetical protein